MQGLNLIAAILIKYLGNEEDAFFALVYIMIKHKHREYYQSKNKSVIDLCELIKNTLQGSNPLLSDHIMN